MKRSKWTRGHMTTAFAAIIFKCIVVAAAVLFAVPLVMTVAGSVYMDGKLTFEGYGELFFNCFPIYRMFWNSVLYACAVTAGAVVISVPAAFAFKYVEFKGKKILYMLYITLMLLPLQIMILPNYIGLRDLHLLNTRGAVIVPLIFSPLCTVVIRQYMESGAMEEIEAARLETSSCVKILWHCVIPRLYVCICAAALVVFADTWNLVEQPLLYLNDDAKRNLAFFFSNAEEYMEQTHYPAAVLFMLPPALWYFCFRRELRDGLAAGR